MNELGVIYNNNGGRHEGASAGPGHASAADREGDPALVSTSGLTTSSGRTETFKRLYLRGALLHLTNPKAVLVWVSIVALSSNGAGATHGAVIPGCAVIGCIVFSGYALVFSMDSARRFYARTRRALEGCLAIVFGVAGIRLLGWSSQ